MSLSQDKTMPRLIISEHSNSMHKESNIFEIIEKLKILLKELRALIPNNITIEINEKINAYFGQINEFVNIITEIINTNNNQNESLQRKDEQSLRILYGKYFNQKLVNEVLENKIYFLNKKEKEYELLKQKTGAIICNGQIICNERKDNEIIILRTENSLLKNAIKNNEDLLKEKNEMINTLNNDISVYKRQIEELRREKHSSFSNINININESKKDFIDRNIKSNKNNLNKNTMHFFPSTKNSMKRNSGYINKKNNNSINNIYSSYQMNSQLINRVNFSKNKNRINNREEIFLNNNTSKNNNKNETMDSLNNQNYSIKYISVNKSLFSPKNNKNSKINYNNSNNFENKTLQINKIKKNKYLLNNNLTNREYNTITIEPSNINKEVRIKKQIINNRVFIKHKKANSIQRPGDSIKSLMANKYEKNLSIENENSCSHVYSAIRKLNKIKNQSMKNNNSLPLSILRNLSDGFKKSNQAYSQKCLANFLMPYADRKKDNRGRNDNSKIGSDYIKDNTLSFFHKTFINRTSCGDNLNRKRNSSSMIYNNSVEIRRGINNNFNK